MVFQYFIALSKLTVVTWLLGLHVVEAVHTIFWNWNYTEIWSTTCKQVVSCKMGT